MFPGPDRRCFRMPAFPIHGHLSAVHSYLHEALWAPSHLPATPFPYLVMSEPFLSVMLLKVLLPSPWQPYATQYLSPGPNPNTSSNFQSQASPSVHPHTTAKTSSLTPPCPSPQAKVQVTQQASKGIWQLGSAKASKPNHWQSG